MSKSDDIIDAVAKKAEVDEAEVRQRIDDKLEDLKENQSSDISEDALRGHAVSIVKNALLNISGGGGFGGGDPEDLPILTIGFHRREGDYFVTDDDAVVGAGVINPKEDPAGFAMFVLDSAHGVDLEHAAEAFMPLNTVRGFAAKRQVGSFDNEPTFKKGGQPTYVVNSTEDSTFEMVDPDEAGDGDPLSQLPADREAKRDLIHNNFIKEVDKVTLQTYAEHETVKNNNGYELGFGVDVKRIRGEVVDSVVFDSGDGVMTLTDDTIFDEDDIPNELISDKMRTPGLQVAGLPSELIHGEDSVLDVYGFIQQRDDGQYRMQGLGVIPIVSFEYTKGSKGGSKGQDDAVEEDTI